MRHSRPYLGGHGNTLKAWKGQEVGVARVRPASARHGLPACMHAHVSCRGAHGGAMEQNAHVMHAGVVLRWGLPGDVPEVYGRDRPGRTVVSRRCCPAVCDTGGHPAAQSLW